MWMPMAATLPNKYYFNESAFSCLPEQAEEDTVEFLNHCKNKSKEKMSYTNARMITGNR